MLENKGASLPNRAASQAGLSRSAWPCRERCAGAGGVPAPRAQRCPCLSQDLSEDLVFARPNIHCHFTQGIGEPKYLPVPSWPSLNKLLGEALENYNEVNAVMNLVSSLPRDVCVKAARRHRCDIALSQLRAIRGVHSVQCCDSEY